MVHYGAVAVADKLYSTSVALCVCMTLDGWLPRKQKFAMYLAVSSGDLLTKWAGQSERHVRESLSVSDAPWVMRYLVCQT